METLMMLGSGIECERQPKITLTSMAMTPAVEDDGGLAPRCAFNNLTRMEIAMKTTLLLAIGFVFGYLLGFSTSAVLALVAYLAFWFCVGWFLTLVIDASFAFNEKAGAIRYWVRSTVRRTWHHWRYGRVITGNNIVLFPA